MLCSIVGNARSAPAGDVIAQVRALVERGAPEIVLTGVDLTSWGGDLPGAPKLGNLVARILKLVPDLKQLRLSSIDAIEMDDALFDLRIQRSRIQSPTRLARLWPVHFFVSSRFDRSVPEMNRTSEAV